MNEPVDYSSPAYAIGGILGRLAVAALLIAFLVWLIRSRRSSKRSASVAVPVRTPDKDIALLAWSLTLHVAHDQACALAARAMGGNPLVEFVDPAVPTWRVNGGYPVIALTPTPAGSLLAAREIAVPLPSPQGAAVWELVLEQVAREADRSGVRISRTQQHLVAGRTLDNGTSIWGPAD